MNDLTKHLRPTAAFQVITRDGHCFAIWADGRTEGFAPDAIVINRIPALVNHTRVTGAVARSA